MTETANRSIYLYDDYETVTVDTAVPFVCTNTFFNICGDLEIDSIQLIEQIVFQDVFLITFDSKSSKRNRKFNILTEEVILVCALEDKGHFTITSLKEKTVGKQNHFIKNALKLRSKQGAVLWHGNNYIRGNVNPQVAISRFKAVKNQIISQLEALQSSEPNTAVDMLDNEEFSVSNELDYLLNLAENYVIAEDVIQKASAQSGPGLSYYHFETASDYNRVEKIAYEFKVNEFDQSTYKKGARVILHLDGNENASGVIMEMDVEDISLKMIILFDEQFDVNKILPQGMISLEYNAVQRIVREEVIEDIRQNKSSATYIDPVLSKQQFAGFADKNVDDVIAELKYRSKPPNTSQIEAIKKGIQTKDALLVLGPPGTGKTSVILEWVKYFVEQENLRVLVSSQNNKAVDNVLEQLVDEDEIDTIRVGSEEKIQANIQHLMFQQRAYELQQEILSANKTYTHKTVELKNQITSFKQKIAYLHTVEENLHTLTQELTKLYQKLQEQYLSQLIIYYQQNAKQKQKLDQLKTKKQHLDTKIAGFSIASGWLKALSWVPYIYRKISNKKILKQYEELYQQNRELVVKYDQLMVEMQQFKSSKLEPLKTKWREQSSHKEKTLGHINDLETTDLEGKDLKLSVNNISPEQARSELQELIDTCNKLLDKLNKAEQALKRWNEFLESKKNHALSKVLLETVDVVGATCIGINSQQRFQNLDFDVTIMDEAGQIQIHNAIVPMSRSKKAIMLGDHLQIPPIADEKVKGHCEENEVDTSLLSKSLFEYLYDKLYQIQNQDHIVLLDTQYRMPSNIADLLSEWFYGGKYQTCHSKIDVPTPFPQLFKNSFVLLDTSKNTYRRETKLDQQGCYNNYEADVVVEILKAIIAEANPEDKLEYKKSINEIGVITPYKKQVQHIRNKIMEEIPVLSKSEVAELVASLDSFQGQERSVIIYSCTRSNNLPPHLPRIGFLKELRRLNVALSRCQEQLIFIGDLFFLSSCEHDGFTQEEEDILLAEISEPEYGRSELMFSQFIRLMIDYAQRGKAEHLSAPEFVNKLKS